MNINVIVFFLFLSSAYASVKLCYDCSPQKAGNCKSPDENSISVTTCETQAEKLDNDKAEQDYECFTFYISGNETSEGFYRGCTEKKENSCYTFREQYEGITGCSVCQSDKCNTENEFKKDETYGNGSVALTFNFGFSIIMLCLLKSYVY